MLWQPTRGILQPNQHWRRGQGSAALGLQTSLTAFWQFENTSWTDELGTNDLTGANSPTSVAGVVGNAVKFDSGASMKLSHTSATALVMDTSAWSFQLWANLATASATGFNLMSKTTGGFGNIEWSVGTIFTSDHFWAWRFTDTFDDSQTVVSTTTLATGWHHLVGTWDATTMRLYVDGGTATTATPPLPPYVGTSTFEIGQAGTASYASASCDVMIDQVGLWKGRTLSSGDVALLYNSGAGLTYAAMA